MLAKPELPERLEPLVMNEGTVWRGRGGAPKIHFSMELSFFKTWILRHTETFLTKKFLHIGLPHFFQTHCNVCKCQQPYDLLYWNRFVSHTPRNQYGLSRNLDKNQFTFTSKPRFFPGFVEMLICCFPINQIKHLWILKPVETVPAFPKSNCIRYLYGPDQAIYWFSGFTLEWMSLWSTEKWVGMGGVLFFPGAENMIKGARVDVFTLF